MRCVVLFDIDDHDLPVVVDVVAWRFSADAASGDVSRTFSSREGPANLRPRLEVVHQP